MSKHKIDKDTIVEIEWLDSMGYEGWGSRTTRLKDMDDTDSLVHKTAGYLVKKAKDYVAVCHSYGVGVDNVDGVIQIPRRAIRKMTIIHQVGLRRRPVAVETASGDSAKHG